MLSRINEMLLICASVIRANVLNPFHMAIEICYAAIACGSITDEKDTTADIHSLHRIRTLRNELIFAIEWAFYVESHELWSGQYHWKVHLKRSSILEHAKRKTGLFFAFHVVLSWHWLVICSFWLVSQQMFLRIRGFQTTK